MIQSLLIVGAGGAAGSMLRYLIQRSWNNHFPYGTICVNIAGCFLIGILLSFLTSPAEETKRLLLIAGFCGGFTTFSAFTAEGIQMLMDNRWPQFILYVTISVAAGLLATWAGIKITQSFL